jgi:hypothetical protein
MGQRSYSNRFWLENLKDRAALKDRGVGGEKLSKRALKK